VPGATFDVLVAVHDSRASRADAANRASPPSAREPGRIESVPGFAFRKRDDLLHRLASVEGCTTRKCSAWRPRGLPGRNRDGIERQVLEQADVDRIGRDVAHQDRVAVGCGARRELGGRCCRSPRRDFPPARSARACRPASAPPSVRRCRCRRRAGRRRSCGTASRDRPGLGPTPTSRARASAHAFTAWKPMSGYYRTLSDTPVE